MFDYCAELKHRIHQFSGHLASMDHRTHEVAHGPCFMIFEGIWSQVHFAGVHDCMAKRCRHRAGDAL